MGDGEPLGCVFDGRVTARVWGTGNRWDVCLMGESQPGCGDGEPLGCVFDGRVTARVWGRGTAGMCV